MGYRARRRYVSEEQPFTETGIPILVPKEGAKALGAGEHQQCTTCGDLTLRSRVTKSGRCPSCKGKHHVQPAVTIRYLEVP